MNMSRGIAKLAEIISYPVESIILCGEIWVATDVL